MKKTIRLSESDLHRLIKESVKRVINEAYLYTKGINPKDLRISGYWTQDGYAQWEANVDNGWYSFRGTYDGVECTLDEIVQGHSGYGHSIEIDDEAIEWFNQNLADKVKTWIENYAENQTYDESKIRKVVKESVRRILKEGNDPLGWNYGGGYQVCIFPTRNGGMKASVIEIGSPVREDALQVCYTGTLEDCEARAEKWNAKNYWNR